MRPPSTRCNIWHIAGRDRDLLFDTGMRVMPLAPEITKLSGRPVLCFGSHSHFDHIGGHHEFPERLMHLAETDIMAEPNRDNMIIEGWVRTDTFDALPHEGFEPERYTVQAAPITQPVGDGDVIDLGDRVFKVLHREAVVCLNRQQAFSFLAMSFWMLTFSMASIIPYLRTKWNRWNASGCCQSARSMQATTKVSGAIACARLPRITSGDGVRPDALPNTGADDDA